MVVIGLGKSAGVFSLGCGVWAVGGYEFVVVLHYFLLEVEYWVGCLGGLGS